MNKSINNKFGKLGIVVSFLLICTTTVYANHSRYTKRASSITVSDVITAQNQWANGVVAIGRAYINHQNYNRVAQKMLNKLYAYNYKRGIVLFKPTKAKQIPFRNTTESALSYFVGDNANFKEDKGFAIQPWVKVVFYNNEMYFHKDLAIVMGEYIFTSKSGSTAKVEYTFGYIKTQHGDIKIVLHHSSLPFAQ